jgi:hypothetical protein
VCSRSRVGESLMCVVEGDVEGRTAVGELATGTGQVGGRELHRAEGTIVANRGRHAEAGKLGAEERRFEAGVVGDEDTSAEVVDELVGDVSEGRGVLDVSAAELMDVGGPQVAAGVDDRLERVLDGPVGADVNDPDLDDLVVVLRRQPSGLEVDDGVAVVSHMVPPDRDLPDRGSLNHAHMC